MAETKRSRVNTSKRGGGVEAERRLLAAACRQRGWRPPTVVEQTGVSAEDPDGACSRQALPETAKQQPLAVANSGPLVQLVSSLNALTQTAHRQGWALVALDCAPETPAERPASLLASFAPLERSLHAKRIRQALAAKRAHGVRLGRPATMSAYAIDRINQEHAAGRSLTEIANGLNSDRVPTAQGGKAWYPATIRHTLNRTH
jgi:Resolvase, N terminal domain/Recombinase